MRFYRFSAISTILYFLAIVSGCNEKTKTESKAGSVVQISPMDLKVGEETIINIKITAPEGGIAVDGGILFPFYMKPWNGLIKGVSEDKKSNSMVTATRSDGGKIEVENIQTNPQWDILSDMKLFIRETPLSEGEKINVQFGSNDMKVVVGRKQLSLFIELELDQDGDGEYVKVKPPGFPVSESEPVKLCLVTPDYVKIGEDFEVVVYGEDARLNVCEKFEGTLDISELNDESGNHLSYVMRHWDPQKDLDRNSFKHTFSKAGTYYLKAVDQDRGLTAISNPVIVSEELPEKKLFWGEIHVHSQISDGRGELQDVYRDGYARGLDFVAITDHSFGRDDRGSLEDRINDLCKEADRFNRPGEFVAIPAGETHYVPVMHMNMYFEEADPEKILQLVNRIGEANKDLRKNWKGMTPEQLRDGMIPYWNIFKEEAYMDNTLVFPHHTMWLGIKPFIDPERTRVIEVCSVHGTSEIRDQTNTPKSLQMKANRMKGDQDQKFSVREILNDGIRLGFAGGSDSHEGQAGYNAITGVFCDELTRSSIIRGIYDKDCYATTSNRTLIEITRDGEQYNCLVAGDGEIDMVQVIFNGEVVYELAFDERVSEFGWIPSDAKEGYFYVKVILEDGKEAAWSSPVWM